MSIVGKEYLRELEAEAAATRKCLERIPGELFDWKPHEKSMLLGYLAQLVAEIPRWIYRMVKDGEIDLTTFEHTKPSDSTDLAKLFDDSMNEAREVLRNVTDERLAETFSLKRGGQILFSSPIGDTISSSINHMVHHRGQLTVYLRLNDIAVPSIYGPSADDQGF